MLNEPVAMQKEELWKLLVDVVHAIPMYKNHKRFVEEVMMKEKPEISSQELAVQLNMTVAEAIVILDEIRGGKRDPRVTPPFTSSPSKASDHSLLDFTK